MTLATCELICLKQLLKELRFKESSQMYLVFGNQATLTLPPFMREPNRLRWIVIS